MSQSHRAYTSASGARSAVRPRHRPISRGGGDGCAGGDGPRRHWSRRDSALPESRPRLRGAGPRPRVADDARGEGLAAHEPGGGHPAAGRAGLRVVERVPARRGAGRRRHRLPAGDRPRRHVRRAAHPRDGGRDRGRGAAPSTTSSCARASAAATRASPSGRPTSTSSATRAGGGGRRPTARTRSSRAGWASRS